MRSDHRWLRVVVAFIVVVVILGALLAFLHVNKIYSVSDALDYLAGWSRWVRASGARFLSSLK